MAEGGGSEERFQTTCMFSFSTDIMYDFYCELCKDDGKNVEAEGYCKDCCEYLCGMCYSGHTRSRQTRHHELLDKDKMPKEEPLPYNRVSREITTVCQFHSKKYVKYFCKTHSFLGCTTCFLTSHRMCEYFESITEKSENILESKEYKEMIENLKLLGQGSRDIEGKARSNIKEVKACYSKVTDTINNLKKQVIETFERLEKDALAEAAVLVSEEEQKMTTLSSKCSSMSDSVDSILAHFQSLEPTNRVRQIYISWKQKSEEMQKLQDEFRLNEETLAVRKFRFEPDIKFQEIVDRANVLGKILIEDSENRRRLTVPKLEATVMADNGTDILYTRREVQAKAAKGKLKELKPKGNAPCDDPVTMTALEKISGILKDHRYQKENEISCINTAINRTTPRPPHKYYVEDVELANRRLYFVGLLRFGPLVIGRGNGFTKKACKADTFQKAFKHLTTKSLEELAYSLQEDPKLDLDKTTILARKQKTMSRELPLEERLGEFLKAMDTPDPNSYVQTMDVAAFHCSLSLTIMYKCKPTNHLKPAMDIDMFLEDMHVAHHSGSMKQDCMQAAYQLAWEYLSNQTVEGLLKNANKVNRDDLWGPYMVTVTRKGNGSTVDSNVKNLKRYGHDLSKISNNKLEDLVILELGEVSQNRQKNCVSIMNLSCMHNGLLLQWETESILNTYSTVNARCQVFIQRQKVGESYGVGKAQAKELAFREALFKFYETQPVIRMVTKGDDKNWISYETLQKEGEELEKRGIKPDLPIRDEEGNFLSSYITKCAYEKIKRFAEKNKGEIIFGPGMTSDEGKEICFIGRMLDLKCDFRSHEGHPYMLFYKHIDWAKLVGQMSPTEGLYGKYFRVPNDKVPKYAEVRDQILKQPLKQMQDYTVTTDEEVEREKPVPAQAETKDFTSELEAFGHYLSTIEQDRTNPITMLVSASRTCPLSLNLEYTVKEMKPVAGYPMFTGLLTINDQYIVRDIGFKKKELKQEVHRKAIDIIMNRPGLEIVGTKDPGPKIIKREMEEKIQAKAAKDLETFKEKVFETESKAPCIDTKTMTALEKISYLLKNSKNQMENEIICIDMAISRTKPRPHHKYYVEEIELANGQLYFVGLLRFGHLVIGRGNGLSKKACKLDTFQKAFKHLTTKSLEELAYSVPEEHKLEIGKIKKRPRKQKAIIRELALEERLGEFLKAMASPDPNSYVKTIDVAAFHCSLSLIVIYKCKPTNHLKPAMDIDLFLEYMHVAHCSGSMKRVCMQAAYQLAWEYLSKQTVEGLLKNANKINRDDLWGPYMMSVTRKGNGITVESNVTNLKRYGHDLSKISNNKLEDLVILEQGEVSQDRQKNCVSILNLSCMHNGLLLQWETESIQNTYSTVNARCEVFIQWQKVGESYGVGKAQAKELAFREALFKFYETQPVIRMVTEGDAKNWISYETLQKEGEELEKRGIKPDLPIRDEEGNFLSSYITKCAYEKIKHFAENKTGEIIFGPGMTSDEGKEIGFIGRMLNLKCDFRSHEGHPYMLFFKHIEWARLVGCLGPFAGLYGKYFRVPNDKVPKYDEVRDQILKQPNQ